MTALRDEILEAFYNGLSKIAAAKATCAAMCMTSLAISLNAAQFKE